MEYVTDFRWIAENLGLLIIAGTVWLAIRRLPGAPRKARREGRDTYCENGVCVPFDDLAFRL